MVLNDHFAKRVIDEGTYRLALGTLRAERAEIERKLAAISGRTRPEVDLRGTRTVWDVHTRLDVAGQQLLLPIILRSVLLDRAGIQRFSLQPVFRDLFKATTLAGLPRVA